MMYTAMLYYGVKILLFMTVTVPIFHVYQSDCPSELKEPKVVDQFPSLDLSCCRTRTTHMHTASCPGHAELMSSIFQIYKNI